MNTNCLEGVACPECGSEGPFRISGCSIFEVWDGGTEGHEDVEWGDDSVIQCKSCPRCGTLGEFRKLFRIKALKGQLEYITAVVSRAFDFQREQGVGGATVDDQLAEDLEELMYVKIPEMEEQLRILREWAQQEARETADE